MAHRFWERLQQAPLAAALAFILFAELASAACYFVRSEALYTRQRLSFRAPEDWQALPIDPEQVGSVSYDRGRRYHMSLSPGVSLDLLSLEFEPGHNVYAETFVHPIKVCNNYSGKSVVKEFPRTRLVIAGQQIELESILMEEGAGRPNYIFRAVWLHNAYGCKSELSSGEQVVLAFQRLMPGPPALLVLASIAGVPEYETAFGIFQRECLAHIVPVTAGRVSKPPLARCERGARPLIQPTSPCLGSLPGCSCSCGFSSSMPSTAGGR